MSESIVLVEHERDWPQQDPRLRVVSAREYLSDPEYGSRRGLRVVNLCRSYRYLSVGYFCSLLAEARGHRAIPSPRTILDLSGPAMFAVVSDELSEETAAGLQRKLRGRADARLELLVCFGRALDPDFATLGRLAFERFPAPVLSLDIRQIGLR